MADCRRRSRFRPCIDLHDGKVKQIVGGTLSDDNPGALRTKLCREKYDLQGGHVIKLGPGNEEAAREALEAWPDALQIGGGITATNAREWLDAGASKVIVTSYLFPGAKFSRGRLDAISNIVGRDRLVVDVSCRRRGEKWFVAMNKWQDITDTEVSKESLDMLSEHCSEFLIHAADVEGLCQGIDEQLVKKLGEWVTMPTTYAGGAKRKVTTSADVSDLALVDSLSGGKVDLTYGR
ncbi:Phosphoribosylformimino-5-aminoimidazole carboxamide ribotide isomerase [Boletus edulis]|nr:Phosphoribosylformimino-5-aminoimidazole carboxamide ribotide isomerase [Boletus edulis]